MVRKRPSQIWICFSLEGNTKENNQRIQSGMPVCCEETEKIPEQMGDLSALIGWAISPATYPNSMNLKRDGSGRNSGSD
jgi:hypothetical protein